MLAPLAAQPPSNGSDVLWALRVPVSGGLLPLPGRSAVMQLLDDVFANYASSAFDAPVVRFFERMKNWRQSAFACIHFNFNFGALQVMHASKHTRFFYQAPDLKPLADHAVWGPEHAYFFRHANYNAVELRCEELDAGRQGLVCLQSPMAGFF